MIWLSKVNYVSGDEEWWRLDERTALSPREAYIRPARVRRFRVQLGTDSVRSKLLHYMCQWVRRLSRVKQAVICGALSDLRRWACLTCERRCQLIQCVRKYNWRFHVHIHLKTKFIFPTLETRRDSSDGGPVQRGRRKVTELHTSGAKPASTW